MKTFALSLLLLIQISPAFSTTKHLTLENGIKAGLIRPKVQKVTGFKGKCLTLELYNASGDSVYVLVPAGWVFDSDDSTKQNLMVVKDFIFKLKTKEKKSELMAVNCIQQHSHSPSGSSFSKAFGAKKELRELAEYLSDQEFQEQTICSAVWAVSDNAAISQICGSGAESDDKLRKKVAEIKGITVPWYKVKTKLTEEENGNIRKQLTELYGEFDCNIPVGTEYQVKLTDKKGNEIMTLSPLRNMAEENKKYSIQFPISHLPEKEFCITFYDKWGVAFLQKKIDLRI